MRNFRQIAEDCLAGKLSGTFILRDGSKVNSHHLKKLNPSKHLMCSYSLGECWISNDGNAYGETGYLHKVSIINFIPDMKKEQITIDIPEGKVPVMKRTEKGVVITWEDPKLTYNQIYQSVYRDDKAISSVSNTVINSTNTGFLAKTNVLRKLINIRNYFGKPKCLRDGVVIKCTNSYCGVETGQFYFDKPDLDSLHEVVFAEKEHAQAAIDMLGDELKYLFEPW